MKKTDDNLAKPFLKWAGGKGQLLKEIEQYYPFENRTFTKYAEPFVGGGAVLFDILNKYDLEEVYISDINDELINAYRTVRDDVDKLIEILSSIQNEFIMLNMEDRKEYYYKKRDEFNRLIIENKSNTSKAAIFIFLNKTCFNGLYRVNKKGLFNVPMGMYKNPLICDEKNLKIAAEKLQGVQIVRGDYSEADKFIDRHTFVYFDPPYRPLSATSNFTAYAENEFDDAEQERLAEFVKKMSKRGAKAVVSNSDPKNVDINDNFFDEIYESFNIMRIFATRMINSKSENRGEISELLIAND